MSPRRILFAELLGGLGDVVIALPAIHALARSHPGAALSVLTLRPGAELLEDYPAVAEVLTPEAGESAAGAMQRVLAPGGWDVVVCDARYEGIDAMVQASGARHRVSNLWRAPRSDELIERRFVRLLAADGLVDPAWVDVPPALAVAPAQREWARAWLDEALPGPGPRVLLVPDSGMGIKRWAPARFRALGALLGERHGARVVVPSTGDGSLAAAVLDGLPGGAVAPAVSLRGAAALAAEVDLCVAGDTGLTRIAAAVGTPTVALFGPSWAGRFGLAAPHLSVQSPVPCPVRNPMNMTEQSCWYSGRCVFDGRATCMEDIEVETIATLARDALKALDT